MAGKRKAKAGESAAGAQDTSGHGILEVSALAAALADDGWHYDDHATALKLAASVRRFGQLRPVLVRRDSAGTLRIVDGRALVRAMVAAERKHALTIDISDMSEEDAALVAFACQLRAPIDFVKLAVAVTSLLNKGKTALEISALAPLAADRIALMPKLLTFDWSQYRPGTDDQHEIDWENTAADQPAVEPIGTVQQPVPSLESATPGSLFD